MAIDFIHVDTGVNATQASLLLDTVRTLRQAYDKLGQVKRIMGHMNDGSDFALIETRFGLPSGTGQAVFDLFNGAHGSMEGTFQVADAKTLTERVG